MDPAGYNNTCLERYAHLYNSNINVMAVANHFWSTFGIEIMLSTITCAKSSMNSQEVRIRDAACSAFNGHLYYSLCKTFRNHYGGGGGKQVRQWAPPGKLYFFEQKGH